MLIAIIYSISNCLALKLKKSKPLTNEVSLLLFLSKMQILFFIFTYFKILNLMINECFIQFELENYSQFITNARNLLFQNLFFVLEPENVNGWLLKIKLFLIFIYLTTIFF
jgi:hypothetical protein